MSKPALMSAPRVMPINQPSNRNMTDFPLR
jgi:hypothetical protein